MVDRYLMPDRLDDWFGTLDELCSWIELCSRCVPLVRLQL